MSLNTRFGDAVPVKPPVISEKEKAVKAHENYQTFLRNRKFVESPYTQFAFPGAIGTAIANLGLVATGHNSPKQYEPGQDPKSLNKKGYNLPGHKYIGPGNSLNRGVGVDEDDLIAEEHDKAYDKAKTEEDIKAADEKGFQEFLTDWIENKNWHSLLGAIGLKGKAYVEKVTGQLYPNIPDSAAKEPNKGMFICRCRDILIILQREVLHIMTMKAKNVMLTSKRCWAESDVENLLNILYPLLIMIKY